MSGALTSRAQFFGRHRVTVDYNDQVSNFSLADLSYNLDGGLDAVAEGQFIPGVGFIPRFGLQYFKDFGRGNLFIIATIAQMERPNVEIVVSGQYTPQLRGATSLLTQVEAVTNAGQGGHNFSIQRFRFGFDIRGYQFGAGLDLGEDGNQPTTTYNIGGFLKKNL